MSLLETSLAGALAEPLSRSDPKGARKYTHVLVVVLGWNTVQEEAVRNMNSIALNLSNVRNENSQKARANGDESSIDPFRPLVIGLT